MPSTLVQPSIRDRIRDAGLRATPGRIAVYQVLAEAESPLTHTDLVDATTHLGLDRATIYRNLVDLADAGLLKRSDLGDHVWRFEIPDEHHPDGVGHAHFVCIDCGEIQCLTGVDIRPQTPAKDLPRAVQDQEVEIQVRGLCDKCG